MIPVRQCLKLAPLCCQIRHGSRMFPQLKRGSFNRITDEDVNLFAGIVGQNGVRLSGENCHDANVLAWSPYPSYKVMDMSGFA